MVPILVALQMEAFMPHLRHRKLQTLYQSPTWTRNRQDKANLFGGVQARLVRLRLAINARAAMAWRVHLYSCASWMERMQTEASALPNCTRRRQL